MKSNASLNMIETKQNRPFTFKGIISKIVPFLGIIIIVLVFSILTNGQFLNISNLQLIVKQAAIVIVAGYGATFVMAHGNMDLSIGGEIAICAIAAYFSSLISPWLVIPVCIVCGILLSSFVGMIHITMRIPHFIIGLCMMFAGRGFAQAMTQVNTMYVPSVYVNLDNIYFYIAVLIVLFIIGYILLEFTKLGRYNKLIGANAESAKLSGIQINKYKMFAFMTTGVTVGICSFLAMVRTGGVSANTGSGIEMDVIIGLVLGGVSLSGGTNTKMRSIVLGGMILFCLSNGLILIGVEPNYVSVIKALVFLISVYFAYKKDSDEILI